MLPQLLHDFIKRSSHILPELSRICDTVAIITKGKLRAFGTLDEIMKQLRQHRTFEIQLVESGQVETAQQVVAKVLAGDAEGKVTASPTEGVVRFESDRSDRDLSALLSQMLNAQILVAQFREVPTDLEDAFLSVTAQDNADHAADTDFAAVTNESENA